MCHNIGKIREIAKNAAKVYCCISPIIKLIENHMRIFSMGSIRQGGNEGNVCLCENLFLTLYSGKIHDKVFSPGGLNNVYGK